MKNIRRNLPGLVILILLLIVDAAFAGILIQTKLLPSKYLVAICILLVIVTAVIYLLVRNNRRSIRFCIGTVLAVLMVVLVCIGSYYIAKGVGTLGQITRPNVEYTDVGVYVLQDDPAQSIHDIEGYTLGILAEQDRENTDKAVAEISDAVGVTLSTREYAGLTDLLDSLITTGETQALVLNSAFIDLLSEMEGYETAADMLREIHIEKVGASVGSGEDQPGSDDDGDNVFSIYISGIDSRTGLIARSRSDVNIVATVNTDTRQILLVSTPRDFYVAHPASAGYKDKLTNAGIYGVENSVGAMEMLYDTAIAYYFRVNFGGFEQIVDALGGITVYSDYTFTSIDGYHYYKGDNNLNGAQALSFARERYSFLAGDRQRGKNQMAVIKGVINKALSPALLTNYASILDSVSGSFETSVPYDVLADLVRMQLEEGGDWNIVSYSVTGSDDSAIPYSQNAYAYVMVPDMNTVNHAIELINQVKNGEILIQE